jgi:preprotein translocase subunit SecA
VIAGARRWIAARRTARDIAVSLARVQARIATWRANTSGDHDALAPDLARARAVCQRQGLRGPSPGEVPGEQEVLACAALAAERLTGAAPSPAVLRAALALLAQGAVELHRMAERHAALALAAVALTASGRPCHVICASDEDAAAAAAALAPMLATCDVRMALLPMDTQAPQALAAYQADVVVATLRRLAGDHARERRYRQHHPLPHAPTPPALEARIALIDDLDRVLIDDAAAPIVLSAADDATQLGEAIAAARALADEWPEGTSELAAQDQARLQTLADRLPPFWRRADRREALLRQALFVRDRLRRGTDYDIAPTGQLLLDDTVHERVPDRDFMVGLTQAVQARAGLPLSPVSRTVERVSVQAFIGAYRRLGGVAACLQGTAGELWRSHGLHVHAVDPAPHAPPPAVSVHADAHAAQQALQDLCARADPASPCLVVLRRMADAAAWQPHAAPGRLALLMDGQGPRGALRDLLVADPAGASRLQLLFAEPLDSRRAEWSLARRVADLSGLPVSTDARPLHPQMRLLGELPGWPVRPAAWLVRHAPALGRAWLRLLVTVARLRAQRAGQMRRASVQQREMQLMQQLSFAAQAPRQPLVSAPPRTHETG